MLKLQTFPLRWFNPKKFSIYPVSIIPDLPGCIAAGETKEEVLSLIREAIEFHLEGLKQHGQPIPPPTSTSELVEIEAA